VSFSRVKARARFEREERRLYVWIPVYENDTTIVPIDVRGYMLSAMLAHTLNVRRIAVTARIRQRIPFVELRHKAVAAQQSRAGMKTEYRYGGTEYYVAVTYSR
jgi:hypothetical protein